MVGIPPSNHKFLLLSFKVITNEEAERRGKEYDANGRTYLFDLDYNDDDCPFTVDAGKSGNISHFVNHSVSQFSKDSCRISWTNCCCIIQMYKKNYA